MIRRRRANTALTVILVLAALVLGFWAGGSSVGGAHSPKEGTDQAGPMAGSHNGHTAPAGKSVTEATIWTCSMHPQIQLPKPGKCPLCGMNLIPLEEDPGGDLDPSMFRLSESAQKIARIVSAPVERRSVTREISMVGKVVYDETRVETISARFPGRLDQLFVDYTGVPVKTGDHLASIYSPELLTAQQELLQAIRASKEMTGDSSFMQETTKATISASREKLRLWGLNPSQIRRIERSSNISDHLTLYAHQSGIVVHKHQSEGDYVQEGSKIYTVADLAHLWVNLDAYEADLSWIHYGQRVSFETEAYPGEIFEGRISFIHPVLDERTRTVKVRVNVENPRGRLKPGMFVRSRVYAELVADGKVYDQDLTGKWISPMHPEVVEDAPGRCRVCKMPLVAAETLGFVGRTGGKTLPLVIPATAPLLTGKRALVYVEVPNTKSPTYEGRVVVLGPRADEYYIIKSGLEEGERVVVQGNFKIDSAVQIKAGPSMMTRPSEEQAVEVSLVGTPFLLELSGLPALLSRVAAALAEGNSDGVSEAFGDALKLIEALPLRGLDDGRAALAKDLRGRMKDTATLGSEAWEAPEQQSALFQLGHLLAEAGLGEEEFEVDDLALFAEVKKIATTLSTLLAADDESAAVALLRSSPIQERVRPTEKTPGSSLLPRWQLFLILRNLMAAENLEEIREHFASLGDSLVGLRRRVPSLEKDAEFMACPMAFSGRGGRWLQAAGPVANPYFGAAMLRCGEPYRPGSGGR